MRNLISIFLFILEVTPAGKNKIWFTRWPAVSGNTQCQNEFNLIVCDRIIHINTWVGHITASRKPNCAQSPKSFLHSSPFHPTLCCQVQASCLHWIQLFRIWAWSSVSSWSILEPECVHKSRLFSLTNNLSMCCSSLLPRDQTHVTVIPESLYCTWTQTYNQDQDPAADCPLIYSICMDFSICYFQYTQLTFLCSNNHYAIQLLFFSGKYRFSWASQPASNQKYTLIINFDDGKTSSNSEETFCSLHCMNKGWCIYSKSPTGLTVCFRVK